MLQRLGAKQQEKKKKLLAEYRNPQNEPGSDKRMLLALVAVFVVLGVMQYFMPKPQTPPAKGQQQQQQQTGPADAQPRGSAYNIFNAGLAQVSRSCRKSSREDGGQ